MIQSCLVAPDGKARNGLSGTTGRSGEWNEGYSFHERRNLAWSNGQ